MRVVFGLILVGRGRFCRVSGLLCVVSMVVWVVVGRLVRKGIVLFLGLD